MDCVISEDILHAARLSPDELKREIGVFLFKQGRLTLGQASQLAEMPMAEFQHLLASRDVAPHYDVEDLEDDVETLRNLGRI
jgi:predicted HTH domain antitoxin